MKLTEDLLHFIWRYKFFNPLNLKTTSGEELQIVSYGQYNTNAGPDFEHASICLNNVIWSGHIEIHIKSSDWVLHQHQKDPAYNNTILHVVWIDDIPDVLRKDGTNIPTLNLQQFIYNEPLEKYERLMASMHAILCHKQISSVDSLIINNWLDRMLFERLQLKYESYTNWIKETNGDWERIFLLSLGRAMGMRVNSEGFEELILRMPLSLIRKYSSDSLKIEALVFGIAGFLADEIRDEYYMRLKHEFAYLQRIHKLTPMNAVNWKFMRMRPSNFPTVRLAQLTALLLNFNSWFSRILESDDLDLLKQTLNKAEINSYWHTHYRFGKSTVQHPVGWSKSFLDHICINAIIPTLYAYGAFIDYQLYKDRAINWIQKIPIENNVYVRAYLDLGLDVHSANESQALLHLHRNYCIPRKCLHCAIGLQILK